MRADGVTLGRLMAEAQRGDRRAYAQLLQECAGWLKRFYGRRVPPCQIDDLIQETLMSVHGKRATYDPARPFLPWLAAIARYRWVDQLRRSYRRNEVEIDSDMAALQDDEADVVARMSLDGLLAHLPPAQARAIELVKIEGLSIAEASRATGQSEPLVKVNIHRGLRKLSLIVEQMD
ncbi:sigma-70 family RNA polymerase sigma factor [Sandaracinobacter neustonicus]|uniref:Sigma-70 family RNA polymerase sigma factor n=1 Tax=Sandaracinobacter neustonicus TaxID=1715348 RepID=A0A501XDU2_9SPHN|nr:sigma-70 family RNA polymerase sigma factor [Sandaracinobacter neustonicus]TPE58444.1 sigma-70 family RNA polymerase sigma factor [Sandaracinobacter neustonicus]